MMVGAPYVLALAGGVGGAKLASGLALGLGERLTVLVNTGDDFEHLGLHISPDLDTVMYTLAGLANRQTGWGLSGETWTFMAQVERLGGPHWFRLGDRDLATHAIRTQRLRDGDTLTAVTVELCRRLNIAAHVLPMSDDPVRTMVHSGDRTLPFQDYFVRLKCAIPVTGLSFEGAVKARFNPELKRLQQDEKFLAVICPSNPYLSIDPILALPGLCQWLKESAAAVVAVSPIVAGTAIKGPAAKIMRERGIDASVISVAAHYRDLIDGIVIDETDAACADGIAAMGMAVWVASTVMRNMDDRVRLGSECVAFASRLAERT